MIVKTVKIRKNKQF